MKKLLALIGLFLVGGFAMAQFGPYPIIASGGTSGSGTPTVVVAGSGVTVVTNSSTSYTVASSVSSLDNATNNDIKLAIAATNQSTVVSNGAVAHTITVAGTANQITSSVGTAQALSGNPSTVISIPTAPQLTNVFNAGDQYRTNGSTSTTAYDLIASNNLGSFSTSGGVSTSTVSMGAPTLISSNVTFRPMTVANLPTPSAGIFPVIYASDVITSSGSGGLVFWDGTNWRNAYENCVATSDIKTFILNCVLSGTVVNGTRSTIEQCFNPSALNGISINLPPIPTTYNLTGSGAQIGVAVLSTNVGPSIDIQTGTTSTGDVRIWGALFRPQVTDDYYACGGFVDVDTLCTSAETYYTWMGIGTSANSATAPTSGAFFLYDTFTNSSAALAAANITYTNNWICVMANSGTYQFVNSGLTVQTGASANTNRLGVVVTTAGATFYTNGVLCQSLSTAGAIPAGVTLVAPYYAIKKVGGSVGTTTRHMYIAAPYVHIRYATSRNF